MPSVRRVWVGRSVLAATGRAFLCCLVQMGDMLTNMRDSLTNIRTFGKLATLGQHLVPGMAAANQVAAPQVVQTPVQPQRTPRQPPTYYTCGQVGHVMNECPRNSDRSYGGEEDVLNVMNNRSFASEWISSWERHSPPLLRLPLPPWALWHPPKWLPLLWASTLFNTPGAGGGMPRPINAQMLMSILFLRSNYAQTIHLCNSHVVVRPHCLN